MNNEVSHAKPDELTCGDCIYCREGPRTKDDIFARVCYRNPPTLVGGVTNQGMAIVTARPEIRTDTWACGEFDTDEDDGMPSVVTPT